MYLNVAPLYLWPYNLSKQVTAQTLLIFYYKALGSMLQKKTCDYSFEAAALWLWNELPTQLRNCLSLFSNVCWKWICNNVGVCFLLSCWVFLPVTYTSLKNAIYKGRELNLAATLASQPAASHNLSFIITIVIMTLGWGLFMGWPQKVAAQFGSHA